MFRAMHHSQLVHDGRSFLEPDHSPPNESNDEMDGENDGGQLPTLHEVCATHVPVLTHIPLAVKAQPFRRILQLAVDPAESESNNALDCFIKLLMLPKALLAAARIKSSETSGAGRHTFINVMKRRVRQWRLGKYHDLWNEAKYLQSPRSSRMPDEEYQDS